MKHKPLQDQDETREVTLPKELWAQFDQIAQNDLVAPGELAASAIESFVEIFSEDPLDKGGDEEDHDVWGISLEKLAGVIMENRRLAWEVVHLWLTKNNRVTICEADWYLYPKTELQTKGEGGT